MTIRLAIAGRPAIELDEEHITLGSDPGCTVCLAGIEEIQPKHAVIRSIDGNWLIEVRDAVALYLGEIPKKAHMIKSGDAIGLSTNGPSLKIELIEESPLRLAPEPSEKKPTPKPTGGSSASQSTMKTPTSTTARPESSANVRPPRMSDVVLLPDSDAELPVTPAAPVKKAVSKPSSSAIIPTTKASSNGSLPKPKPGSSSIIPTQKPPATSTVKAPKAPSSSMISTTKPPSTTSIATPSASSVILSGDNKPKAKPRGTDSNVPVKKAKPSSAQMPTVDSDGNDVPVGVPMLKRLTALDVPVASLDDDELSSYGDSPKRRRSSEHEQDIEWIKMVIIRAAIGGAIALVVLIVIVELWRAMTKPAVLPTATSSVINDWVSLISQMV